MRSVLTALLLLGATVANAETPSPPAPVAGISIVEDPGAMHGFKLGLPDGSLQATGVAFGGLRDVLRDSPAAWEQASRLRRKYLFGYGAILLGMLGLETAMMFSDSLPGDSNIVLVLQLPYLGATLGGMWRAKISDEAKAIVDRYNGERGVLTPARKPRSRFYSIGYYVGSGQDPIGLEFRPQSVSYVAPAEGLHGSGVSMGIVFNIPLRQDESAPYVGLGSRTVVVTRHDGPELISGSALHLNAGYEWRFGNVGLRAGTSLGYRVFDDLPDAFWRRRVLPIVGGLYASGEVGVSYYLY